MAKSRRKTEEVANDPNDVFGEQITERQSAEAVPPTAEPPVTGHIANPSSTPRDHGTSHAAGVERKKYAPPADPFGFENIKAGENRVRLLKSEGEGAWVIRLAHSPNTGEYSKESPHPVLNRLKEEGYRWGFDGGDGKGGWGKRWTNDPYGTDHIEARRVLEKAAEMI